MWVGELTAMGEREGSESANLRSAAPIRRLPAASERRLTAVNVGRVRIRTIVWQLGAESAPVPRQMPLIVLQEASRGRPSAGGFALWQLGFRPFFLLAGVFAAASIAIWMRAVLRCAPARLPARSAVARARNAVRLRAWP